MKIQITTKIFLNKIIMLKTIAKRFYWLNYEEISWALRLLNSTNNSHGRGVGFVSTRDCVDRLWLFLRFLWAEHRIHFLSDTFIEDEGNYGWNLKILFYPNLNNSWFYDKKHGEMVWEK